ncbi:MAG: hypothetical protein ACFFAX_16865, partial [Promethearchaeota archaeon]
GSTLFFDVDVLSTLGGSEGVLTKHILDRRREEIEDTVLLKKAERVELLPLWHTHYGFNLLRSLGYNANCTQSEFSELMRRLSELDLEVKVTKDTSEVKTGCQIPEVHRRLILSRLTPTPYETVEQRLSRLAEFSRFSTNPWVSLRPYEGPFEGPNSEELLRRRNQAAERVNISYEDEYCEIKVTRGSFDKS